ncbi:hypothetical protein TNCV_1987021 [Trichonephila clavipes]|nr:hypothetical protein TNCV_1987021 [Trichonephila clavipes]
MENVVKGCQFGNDSVGMHGDKLKDTLNVIVKEEENKTVLFSVSERILSSLGVGVALLYLELHSGSGSQPRQWVGNKTRCHDATEAIPVTSSAP